ncbi:MAG: hypothetical protein WD826_11300 [Actinomycetota bacterium]
MIEHLHRVRGTVDVALDLVDRATVAYAQAGIDRKVMDDLIKAGRCLADVAKSVEQELGLEPVAQAANRA